MSTANWSHPISRCLKDLIANSPMTIPVGTRGAGTATALTPHAVQKLIRKYAYHAKLEGVTPHRLRHTFSRRFLEESGDLVMLNRLLGHRRLETTAIYTQPTLEEMAEALERQGEG
jgi:integrase/recombinase XerC